MGKRQPLNDKQFKQAKEKLIQLEKDWVILQKEFHLTDSEKLPLLTKAHRDYTEVYINLYTQIIDYIQELEKRNHG